jgi:hypothetical protein
MADKEIERILLHLGQVDLHQDARMSLSTDESPESPDFTEALPTEVDPNARAFPGRVRGQRLEVTRADLTMYSAITGRAPSREERQRALTWSEADPMHEQIAEAAGTTDEISDAIVPVRAWHPSSISHRIRDIWFNGLHVRVPRPQLSNWVRRVSMALQQGRRRMKTAV